MIDPFKYVVFKREELDELLGEIAGVDVNHVTSRFAQITLDDALVIRKQDVFASQALYAYAHQILTTIEILNNPNLSLENIDTDYLQELADFFASQADDAARQGGMPTP